MAATEGSRQMQSSSRGKAQGVPTSTAVTGVKAQKLRSNLKKGGLPIFYRVAALAFSCVAFALIASTGSEECVPIIADAHRVPKADAPPRFWRAPAASRWAA